MDFNVDFTITPELDSFNYDSFNNLVTYTFLDWDDDNDEEKITEHRIDAHFIIKKCFSNTNNYDIDNRVVTVEGTSMSISKFFDDIDSAILEEILIELT